jgi:AraC-like DNA-binding protein
MTDDLFLSTDMVDPDLRTEFWREVTAPVCDTTAETEGELAPLEGSIRAISLGSLLVLPTTFSRQRFRREQRLILEGLLDDYMVQLFIAGTLEGNCDGREIFVGPGDIYILDLARPFDTRAPQGGTIITVALPRGPMEAATRGVSLHGIVLKADLPVTRMLTELIHSLAELGTSLDAADVAAIEAAAVTLLSSSFARHAPARDQTPSQLLRQRALDFIDANLADPGLGPVLLMQHFRVSRAHLYRMFAADGGVARLIRERRLDAAYRALIGPGAFERSITQIAFTFGFSNSDQFRRAFSSRFELSPSKARQERSARSPADQRLTALHASFAAHGRRIATDRALEPE